MFNVSSAASLKKFVLMFFCLKNRSNPDYALCIMNYALRKFFCLKKSVCQKIVFNCMYCLKKLVTLPLSYKDYYNETISRLIAACA